MMTVSLFKIILALTVVIFVCESSEDQEPDSGELKPVHPQMVHITSDKVFQLINVSLSFPRAQAFCHSQFSNLITTDLLEDEEGARELLKLSGLRGPSWVRDSYKQPSLSVSKQYVDLQALSFLDESMEGYARINSYFPPLPAVTVCARIQWHQEHNHVSTIFSYAAPVLINEFQLRGQTKGEGRPVLLALIVQGHHQPYKASFPNDGEWHHVCVSWRSGDMLWVIHVDGERKDFGSVTGAQRNIHGDGIFIIGQDQDSFGGNFTEPFVGNLTDLNVWNEMLDDKQLWVLKVCQPLLNIETLFSWNMENLTVHQDVNKITAKIYCPGILKLEDRHDCKVLEGWSSHGLPRYGTTLCSELLPFICKTTKESYLKMKELKETQSSHPTPFMNHLMQLSGSTLVLGGPPAKLSWKQVSHLLNVSQQALNSAQGHLDPSDMLSLMQILSFAAEVPSNATISLSAAELLSQHFLAVADQVISAENVHLWNTIKQVASGPMAVVRSIDRMVSNLNPLLIGDRERVQIHSDKINLQVQQRNLGNYTDDSKFCGPHVEHFIGQDCISLPSQNMQELHVNGFRKVTLLNTWYDSLHKFFSMEENITVFPVVSDGTQKYLGTILGSSVISSTVLGDGQPISMGVQFQLQHRTQTNVNVEYSPVCAYWDFNLMPEDGGSWSTQGCEVIVSHFSHTTCFCNHTTNFALLLQVYEVQRSPEDEKALQMLTFIGCGVSLCGLGLTLILFTAVGVPKSDRTTVHKNLIVALAAAQLLLMISEWAAANQDACLLVTALLHLFFMASFTWMLVEGLLLWSKVVSVNISEEKRMRLYYTLGWGLPVIIVTITLLVSLNKYKAENHCWLNVKSSIIWAFVGPVLVILSINAVVLCRVIMVTVSSARRRAKMLSPSCASKLHTFDLTWAAARPVLILLPVLGLTWLCGVLVHLSVVVAYLFIALNAFQGLYIFLVYAVYNSEVRNAIKRIQEKRKALSFTNCSQPISFMPSQRTPAASWAQTIPSPSSLDSSDTSSPIPSTTSSLVFKNESFRKDSCISFSLKPVSGNQVIQLTAFKPTGSVSV